MAAMMLFDFTDSHTDGIWGKCDELEIWGVWGGSWGIQSHWSYGSDVMVDKISTHTSNSLLIGGNLEFLEEGERRMWLLLVAMWDLGKRKH